MAENVDCQFVGYRLVIGLFMELNLYKRRLRRSKSFSKGSKLHRVTKKLCGSVKKGLRVRSGRSCIHQGDPNEGAYEIW